jgi:hypothetical protein
MSRGLGAVQRKALAVLEAHDKVFLSTTQVAAIVYDLPFLMCARSFQAPPPTPKRAPPTRSQMSSTQRAIHKLWEADKLRRSVYTGWTSNKRLAVKQELAERLKWEPVAHLMGHRFVDANTRRIAALRAELSVAEPSPDPSATLTELSVAEPPRDTSATLTELRVGQAVAA